MGGGRHLRQDLRLIKKITPPVGFPAGSVFHVFSKRPEGRFFFPAGRIRQFLPFLQRPLAAADRCHLLQIPVADLTIHKINQEIPGLIASGAADVMITEVMEAGYYVGQDSRLAAPLIHEPFTRGGLGVLLPKGSEDLLSYVNDFLAEEKASGRIDELAEEYIYRYTEEEELEPAA